jgi:hypothetical protein
MRVFHCLLFHGGIIAWVGGGIHKGLPMVG